MKTYEVKYGFATGLLLYVSTLQTIRKVYQANKTIYYCHGKCEAFKCFGVGFARVNFPPLSCLLVFCQKL